MAYRIKNPQVKLIPLTQGKSAMVDAADYGWLNRWKWFAVKWKHGFYARRKIGPTGKKSTIEMQVVILGRKGVDHRDGNGLNNTRCNLRPCSRSQNNANARLYSHNTSGFKGVSWDKRAGRWLVQIRKNRKLKCVGLFRSKIKAAKAYDEAAFEFFGEFANTNKMMGLLP